jgi:hypothetical protein
VRCSGRAYTLESPTAGAKAAGRRRLLSPSGIAARRCSAAAGWPRRRLLHQSLLVSAVRLALAGLVLAFTGFRPEAGSGGSAVVQSSLFDLVIRSARTSPSFAGWPRSA